MNDDYIKPTVFVITDENDEITRIKVVGTGPEMLDLIDECASKYDVVTRGSSVFTSEEITEEVQELIREQQLPIDGKFYCKTKSIENMCRPEPVVTDDLLEDFGWDIEGDGE